MYERKIDDAIRQLQAGSVDAPEELTLIALVPACTLEQRQRIASAIYAVLDDVHLQNSKRDKSLPVQQAFCFTCLASINVQLRLCSGAADNSVPRMLEPHWPKLRQWVLYLKNDFIDQENVDFSFRLLAKRCVGDFLGACEDTLLGDLFHSVVASPHIISTLLSLWRLETQDQRFSISQPVGPPSQPIFHTAGTLDSWMSAFSQRENWDWSEILLPFGGDADALATTALDHLRQDIARVPINYDLIVWDVHLLTTFSINENIRVSLLKLCSMTLLTNVVKTLVDRYATTNQHSLVAKCLSYAYWHIRAYVEYTEGLPWITQVVEAGLLPALLSTEPWIKHLNDQDSEDWEPLFLLLDEIIPKYTVYCSVLKLVIKQLAPIYAADLPGKLDKNGQLFESWSMFEETVRPRVALYHSMVNNKVHIESCQSEKCDKTGPPGSLKSCAACHHVNYCSKECQVYDWKTGGHRKYCREIQFRREYCLPLPLPTADVHFLDRLIAHDLSHLQDEIEDAATEQGANPVVVELDYKEAPMQESVGTVGTVPAIQTCQCDTVLAEKWDHMISIALKATSKRVLVRAFFPTGVSERVKLQCLPLWRVLGDDAPSTEGDSTSNADETVDLLYSRAAESGGVVGDAFPDELARSTRERLCAQAQSLD